VGISEGRSQPSNQSNRHRRNQIANQDSPAGHLDQADFHEIVKMDGAPYLDSFPGGLGDPQEFGDGRRSEDRRPEAADIQIMSGIAGARGSGGYRDEGSLLRGRSERPAGRHCGMRCVGRTYIGSSGQGAPHELRYIEYC
jgi:hypothetical protein